MNEIAEHLSGILARRLPASALPWRDRAFGAAHGAFTTEFATATLQLGKGAIELTAGERAALAGAGVTLPAGLGLDELGRMAMLVVLADALPEADLEAVVDDGYRHGDSRERQAVLRALPLLPRPERFVRLAVDACRTHVLPVFEAVACDNPYPARHFPEPSFNQMVLKALFLGVALERVAGLDARSSPELARMAHGYASERRAAGRSVPDDIARFFGGARAPQRSS